VPATHARSGHDITCKSLHQRAPLAHQQVRREGLVTARESVTIRRQLDGPNGAEQPVVAGTPSVEVAARVADGIALCVRADHVLQRARCSNSIRWW
jgi:hypothetical protein